MVVMSGCLSSDVYRWGLSLDMSRRAFGSGQLDSRCVWVVFVSELFQVVFMSGGEFVSERVWAVFFSGRVQVVFVSRRYLFYDR